MQIFASGDKIHNFIPQGQSIGGGLRILTVGFDPLKQILITQKGEDFELFNSYVEGEEYKDLSIRYNVSVVSLRKKIQRIKDKLKKDISVVAFLD